MTEDLKKQGLVTSGYGAVCGGDVSAGATSSAPETSVDDDPFSAIADGWAPVAPRRG